MTSTDAQAGLTPASAHEAARRASGRVEEDGERLVGIVALAAGQAERPAVELGRTVRVDGATREACQEVLEAAGQVCVSPGAVGLDEAMSRERTDFDFADPHVQGYPLLNSLVVPRPIAWVSTRSAEGVGNLAPHSFFTVVCADPGIVAFASIGAKDTLANVRATEEFVVNLVPEWLAEAANHSSARFDTEVDEAAALGITMEPSRRVSPPRVAESPAALECRLHSVVDLETSWLVLGRVLSAAVWTDVLDGDHPRIDRMAPMSRLGRNEWGGPPPVRALDRPTRPEDID